MKLKFKINKQIILLVVFCIVALTAVSLVFWQGVRPFFDFKGSVPEKKIRECVKERALDGVYISRWEKELYPVAVVIDNKHEARPWAGLSYAGLVFEAPVEGGITRFMAVYSSAREIEKIGPVRSVRPYYVDWALGLGALIAHCGGSPQALSIISSDAELRELDLDQFSNGFYYWRSGDRIAPHNLYTSSDRLSRARNKKEITDANFSAWQFKEDAYESERGESGEFRIKFGTYKSYDAVWNYDINKNLYIRQLGDSAAQDEDGALILAKNIAVLETDIWIIDSYSRREIKTIGEGRAVIFQDGKRVEGKWEKPAQGERLRFFNEGGVEIKFNRGTTWVEVVSDLDNILMDLKLR